MGSFLFLSCVYNKKKNKIPIFSLMTNSMMNNIENIEACQNKTVDQLLDTVLTKVGYGTFHKKLLVSIFN